MNYLPLSFLHYYLSKLQTILRDIKQKCNIHGPLIYLALFFKYFSVCTYAVILLKSYIETGQLKETHCTSPYFKCFRSLFLLKTWFPITIRLFKLWSYAFNLLKIYMRNTSPWHYLPFTHKHLCSCIANSKTFYSFCKYFRILSLKNVEKIKYKICLSIYSTIYSRK